MAPPLARSLLPRRGLLAAGAGLALVACSKGGGAAAPAKAVQILNVSYDPTREFYRAYDAAFAAAWTSAGHPAVEVEQSHGGSGKQARAVIDGPKADVVTLALGGDIDAIAKRGLIAPGWQSRLPHNSTPYTSTIVFLVRKGNPKGIKDWADLVKPGVQVITPNPKTSGGARWNVLAAYADAWRRPGGSEAKARAYLAELFKHVPVLDTGARGATTTFVQRGIGDVLLAWENEAFLAIDQLGPGKVETVVPPRSILAEPPVAVVDKVVDQKGTRAVAEAYLKGLYDDPAQDLAVKFGYRPSSAAALAKAGGKFPKLELATIADFGGWAKAQPQFFGDGGLFDQIYKPG